MKNRITHWMVAFTVAFAPLTSMAAYPTVGDPSNPGALFSAIQTAYNGGSNSGGVTIAPGTYTMPVPAGTAGSYYFDFESWNNFVIDAYGVKIVFTNTSAYSGIQFNRCNNVTLAGATIYTNNLTFSQGKITGYGTDSGGAYLDLQIDAGYPADFANTARWYSGGTVAYCGLYNPLTRYRRANSDYFWMTSAIQVSGSIWKFYLNSANLLPGNGESQIGDYVSLYGIPRDGIDAWNCVNLTYEDLYVPWGMCGWGNAGAGPVHFMHVISTYQLTPPGATAPAIVGTDGENCDQTRVGPDIENSIFEGCGDDIFNVHGDFLDVGAVNGTTLTYGWGFDSIILAGDKIRFYDTYGNLIDTATAQTDGAGVTSPFTPPSQSMWRPFQGTLRWYTVTLDHVVAAQYDNYASDANVSGPGMKVLNSALRNGRDVLLLLKGDNADIENSTFDGGTVAGISMDPSMYWSEGGYAHDAVIKNNVFTNCGYANAYSTGQPGALSLGSEVPAGIPAQTGVDNNNDTIMNNTFINNAAINISINIASSIQASNNVILNPHFTSGMTAGQGLGFDPFTEMWIGVSNGVTLSSNLAAVPGPFEDSLSAIGSGATNTVGGDTGINLANIFIYEAENATTLNDCWVLSGGNASNVEYVGGINNSDSHVLFSVNVPVAGIYPVVAYYDNASTDSDGYPVAATQNVVVNGNSGAPVSVNFPFTGAWGAMSPTQASTIFVSLNAGSNTLQFGKGNYWAELDKIVVVSPQLAGYPNPSPNFALNAAGTGYPTPSASYTSPFGDSVWQAIDGIVSYSASLPHNRWTCFGSGNSTDWLMLDFGTAKAFSTVVLDVYDDGGGIRANPYTIQYSSNGTSWTNCVNQSLSPSSSAPNQSNVVTFTPVSARYMRVVFTNATAYSGITEMQIY